MSQLSRFAKRKTRQEKPTLRQRLLGRTLAGRIVRGAGVTAALRAGVGALKIGKLKTQSYLKNVAGTAREKGTAAYKTYATNTGSTQNASTYAEKTQRGSYVGQIKRDLGRFIGKKRAAGLGDWLYRRSRTKGVMAYSRRDTVATFTMVDAANSLYRNSTAQFKKRDEEPKKRGNAITKGLKYGALTGAGIGGVAGVNAINAALKSGELKGVNPGVARAIGVGYGGLGGAAQLGTLGALGGLGVYGVNRLRNRGKKKPSRGLRGRISQVRRRFV